MRRIDVAMQKANGDRFDALGAYLSRDTAQGNPGNDYIRVALVAPQEETQRGLIQLRDCLYD